jgi:hypothetical protein
MKDHTLKELADIGAKASRSINGRWLYGSLTVDPNKSAYVSDAPFREAFAKAVRDAVLADLGANVDSSPDPFAELKAAHAAGKMIQIKALSENGATIWQDVPQPLFNCSVILYRIKPEPVLIPLDIDDIRATDEFKSDFDQGLMQTVSNWNNNGVCLTWTGNVSYADLAVNYLRRQHGSNEWKPCTKEAK